MVSEPKCNHVSRIVAVFNTAEHVFERMCLCLFLCSVGVMWQDVVFFPFSPVYSIKTHFNPFSASFKQPERCCQANLKLAKILPTDWKCYLLPWQQSNCSRRQRLRCSDFFFFCSVGDWMGLTSLKKKKKPCFSWSREQRMTG